MRLRSAMATARLAAAWPDHVAVQLGHDLPRGERVQRPRAPRWTPAGGWASTRGSRPRSRRSCRRRSRPRSSAPRAATRARVEARVADQGAGRGQGVGAAAAHGHACRRRARSRRPRPRAGRRSRSATTRKASSRRSTRSVRHSLDSSTAARSRLPRYSSILASNLREEGQGVRGGAREAGQHLAVVQAADLARAVLHHRLAERDLAVAGEGGVAAVADGEDRRAVDGREAGMGRRSARRRQMPSIGAGESRSTNGPPAHARPSSPASTTSRWPARCSWPRRPWPRALRRAAARRRDQRAAQRRLHPTPGRSATSGRRGTSEARRGYLWVAGVLAKAAGRAAVRARPLRPRLARLVPALRGHRRDPRPGHPRPAAAPLRPCGAALVLVELDAGLERRRR